MLHICVYIYLQLYSRIEHYHIEVVFDTGKIIIITHSSSIQYISIAYLNMTFDDDDRIERNEKNLKFH